MQFPVPQFTDVEDKLIGPLTLKQFGIIFGAGIFIFLAYSASKSLPVLIIFVILFGLPALGLAFAPFNGRPIYNCFGPFFRFFTSPKLLVFHKEALVLHPSAKLKEADLAEPKAGAAAAPVLTADENLHKVEELLLKTAKEEQDLASRIR